jgi:hypothetical protein
MFFRPRLWGREDSVAHDSGAIPRVTFAKYPCIFDTPMDFSLALVVSIFGKLFAAKREAS